MGNRKQISVATSTDQANSASCRTLAAVHRSVDALDAPIPSSNSAASVRTLGRRLFCFPVLLGVFLIAGVVVSLRLSLPDPDTWFHVAAGE